MTPSAVMRVPAWLDRVVFARRLLLLEGVSRVIRDAEIGASDWRVEVRLRPVNYCCRLPVWSDHSFAAAVLGGTVATSQQIIPPASPYRLSDLHLV